MSDPSTFQFCFILQFTVFILFDVKMPNSNILFIVKQAVPLEKDLLADFPSFELLSHLELGNVSCEVLLALLLKTPYLKTLIFQVSF